MVGTMLEVINRILVFISFGFILLEIFKILFYLINETIEINKNNKKEV